MAVAAKLMEIGMIVISILAGLIFFYIYSNLPKEYKKAQIEEMISQLINFIIFIWVGKIILNFSIFIKDPLAILAYPSNSGAFYLAVLFSSLFLFYKSKKGKLDVHKLITSFLPMFLMASFLFEFIHLISNSNTYSFETLTLSTVLLVLFLLISNRVSSRKLILTMLISWSAGFLLLAFTQPFITVFGYIMTPWFIGVFFLTSCLFIILGKKV